MKKNILIETICFLLILLFMYTAVSKFINFDNFSTFVVNQTPLLRPFAKVAAILIPTLELIAVGLLLVPQFRKWGLYVSFVLMAAFTIYVLYALFFAPKVPCACGGIIRQMSWKQHLVFNIAFTLAALAGIWIQKRQNSNNPRYKEVQFA
jgi:uncharacterized membrane protein YphA (DoxX/SURF4 family)